MQFLKLGVPIADAGLIAQLSSTSFVDTQDTQADAEDTGYGRGMCRDESAIRPRVNCTQRQAFQWSWKEPARYTSGRKSL